jgi:acetyl-CoA carboxylase carboxyl transferase subunit alpha
MKVTAQHLKRLGVIDKIVGEPVGGAHRDLEAAAKSLRATLEAELNSLCELPSETLISMREERFLQIGAS